MSLVAVTISGIKLNYLKIVNTHTCSTSCPHHHLGCALICNNAIAHRKLFRTYYAPIFYCALFPLQFTLCPLLYCIACTFYQKKCIIYYCKET